MPQSSLHLIALMYLHIDRSPASSNVNALEIIARDWNANWKNNNTSMNWFNDNKKGNKDGQ